MLKEVLHAFEQQQSFALPQLAAQLGVDVSALEGMIQYWVRKGRLREVSHAACGGCGLRANCNVGIKAAPRRYELVRIGEPVGNPDSIALHSASSQPTCAHCKR